MSQKKKCPAVFLRGGDHLLLAGMTLMLWRGLLWQQWLRWWRREHLFSLVWKVGMCGHSWACEGERVRNVHLCWNESKPECRWPGHLCTSMPEKGYVRLSSFQPETIYSMPYWTNEQKRKGLHPNAKILKQFCHLACLSVFWVVAYHESKEPFNKSLQKYPVKFSVKRQLRLNTLTMFTVLLDCILVPAFFTTYNYTWTTKIGFLP